MKNPLQKIAPLCILGFDGTTVPSYLKKLITENQLAGVILFKRNIESKEQVKALNEEFQSLNPQIPLLISVDHEGGRVFRLPPPFTQIGTARSITEACLKEPNTAFETGALMGRELNEVGFNLNYAPVLDVDSNPANPIIGDRSYGCDPQTVSKIALELVRGLRSQGIIPCGKHFPGHGDTALDSHLALPYVEQDLDRLESIELPPFQAAVDANIEMLMTAHVMYPVLDDQNPATLSYQIITQLLRQKMGYDGVVISDDFLMKAISDRYGIGPAALQFLHAGGDIVLICREEETQREALEFLEKSVMDGKISEEHLAVSRKRVERLLKIVGA